MLGIRERYYSDEEIKGWIKYGKIREFQDKQRLKEYLKSWTDLKL